MSFYMNGVDILHVLFSLFIGGFFFVLKDNSTQYSMAWHGMAAQRGDYACTGTYIRPDGWVHL